MKKFESFEWEWQSNSHSHFMTELTGWHSVKCKNSNISISILAGVATHKIGARCTLNIENLLITHLGYCTDIYNHRSPSNTAA